MTDFYYNAPTKAKARETLDFHEAYVAEAHAKVWLRNAQVRMRHIERMRRQFGDLKSLPRGISVEHNQEQQAA